VSIQVSWDGYITVSGTDLSDHCVQLVLNDGEETRDVTAFGDTSRRFRAALGTASVDATFWNDHSSGSVENVLRSHLLMQNDPSSKTPASAPTAALSGSTGGLIAGEYRYWLTYTFPAFETTPSTYASVTVTSATSGEVALTSIAASTEWFVTGKNIYRSDAGGDFTTAKLLTALANTATSYLDNASSSTLAGNSRLSLLWQAAGFDVVVRKHNTAASTNNPEWSLTAIIDGDLNTLDEKPGEVSQTKVMFRPFGSFAMTTT
jgi:hypothetical protein